jgi:hypothetical protein
LQVIFIDFGLRTMPIIREYVRQNNVETLTLRLLRLC